MAKGKFDDLIKARKRGESPLKGTSERTSGGGGKTQRRILQVSAYIRKDTHRKVKIALLEEDRQFSELVEELLNAWLESRT